MRIFMTRRALMKECLVILFLLVRLRLQLLVLKETLDLEVLRVDEALVWVQARADPKLAVLFVEADARCLQDIAEDLIVQHGWRLDCG